MHLPCKNCGSSLAIIKGSKAQCPYCGAKTLYMESVYSLKRYLTEVLNLTSLRNETHVKDKELERRKFLIRTFFNKLKSNYNDYRHLIITKLDDIKVNPKNLFSVIRSAGHLEVIVEKFLLPHLNEDKIVQKYKELRDHCFVINKSLIGLYYSYLAKNSIYIDKCLNYYNMVEKNYQNIVDYCNITDIENNKSKLFKKKELFQILTEFTRILRDILNRNPKYFSEKLENLLKRLKKLDEKNIQTYNLYSQIEHIYQLERDTCVLLEKVKIDNSFSAEQSLDEDIIFNTEENLEKLNVVRDRIKDISEKYQTYQRELLKLHSGRLIQYLESYRTEFINFKNKNVDKFNDSLETMIHKTFNAYNSEAIEVLKSLSDFIQNDIFNEKIIERFETEHNDLTELDDILKKFTNELFSIPILRNLEKGYYKKLIALISGKHTEFDKYILKYINFIFQKFEENRNKKILTLEEQKNQFSSELKPNLQKLLNLSFDLNEKKLPYPLFIDIGTQNKKLKVNEFEVINLVIENPNLNDIKDIKIYFFMPKSFHYKVKSTSIKKLKAKERRKIKTKILPTERGNFLLMVMAEYHHVNKTFWMPSIKLKLDVEEIIKYKYYPTHLVKINSEFEATSVLSYKRNYII